MRPGDRALGGCRGDRCSGRGGSAERPHGGGTRWAHDRDQGEREDHRPDRARRPPGEESGRVDAQRRPHPGWQKNAGSPRRPDPAARRNRQRAGASGARPVIVYFDTSAFVPMLFKESNTEYCESLWAKTTAAITSRLLYVEAAAATAQALRMKRISEQEYADAIAKLVSSWPDFTVEDIDQELVERAAQLTRPHALRSYDAVHCAVAERTELAELIVASGDRKLLAVCLHSG
ncbi:PIN domain-containing protein [Pseudonocardiaceae bacterium YIM PH 21723]|nr:PIN domain-containing protein [Pseudonocardiaceae bacterium YIM PH 21723]